MITTTGKDYIVHFYTEYMRYIVIIISNAPWQIEGIRTGLEDAGWKRVQHSFDESPVVIASGFFSNFYPYPKEYFFRFTTSPSHPFTSLLARLFSSPTILCADIKAPTRHERITRLSTNAMYWCWLTSVIWWEPVL